MARTTKHCFVIVQKATGKFLKRYNDSYCCYKVELVENIEDATIHDKSLGNPDKIAKVLRHAIYEESEREGFEEIGVTITYSYTLPKREYE